MPLTGRDVGATAGAALVLLVYVANVQNWWYLGSNRWAIVTAAALGVAGCSLGARIRGKPTMPVVLLGALGTVSFALIVVGLVTASHAMLVALTIVLLVLWAGATLRHMAEPPSRALPVA